MNNSEKDSVSQTTTKQPIYKKWWFWIIIIISVATSAVILILINNSTSNNEKESFVNDFSSEDERTFNERVVDTFTPESGTAFKYNSPLIYDEHLYLGTSERTGYDNAPVDLIHDNFFYKMDLDFNVIWQYQLGQKMVTGNAAMDSDHNIYFLAEEVTENPTYDPASTEDKNEQYFSEVELYSLTPEGELRWNVQISPEGEIWNRSMNGIAVSVDDIVYFARDRFYAFDTEGNQIGQYPDDTMHINGFGGAPITDSVGNVYFVSPIPVELTDKYSPEATKAYKFSSGLSSLIWSTSLDNEIMSELNPNYGERRGMGVESTPALGVNEESLIGIVGSTINKFDTQTGELIWSTKPEGIIGYITASPAIDGDDNIFIGSKSNEYSKFFAIKSDGTLLWSREVGADLYNSPVLGDDDTIYVGSETLPDGKYHAYDRLTGEIKWEFGGNEEAKIPDFSFNTGALHEGYIYIGVHSAEEGNEVGVFSPSLYKIRVDANGYLEDSPWPRIYGGNRNNGQ